MKKEDYFFLLEIILGIFLALCWIFLYFLLDAQKRVEDGLILIPSLFIFTGIILIFLTFYILWHEKQTQKSQGAKK